MNARVDPGGTRAMNARVDPGGTRRQTGAARFGVLPARTDVVGGYRTRSNDPEIDLVGADRAPVAEGISFVGWVKWLESEPFGHRDLARLITHRTQLPGADEDIPLVAVARSGCTADGVLAFTPRDLLEAWS